MKKTLNLGILLLGAATLLASCGGDTQSSIASATSTPTPSSSVEDTSLESITLTTTGVKVEYTEGETFDPTNLIVTANYHGSKASAVVTNYAISKTTALELTDTSITISYTEDGVTVSSDIAIVVSPAAPRYFAQTSETSMIIYPDGSEEVSFANTYEYDEKGNLLSEIYYDYSDVTEQLEISYSRTYTYYPDGSYQTENEKSYQDGELMREWNVEFNTNGDFLYESYHYVYSAEYDELVEYIYKYDDFFRLMRYTCVCHDNDEFSFAYYYSYTGFDDYGNPSLEICSYYLDETLTDIDPSTRSATAYTYKYLFNK